MENYPPFCEQCGLLTGYCDECKKSFSSIRRHCHCGGEMLKVDGKHYEIEQCLKCGQGSGSTK